MGVWLWPWVSVLTGRGEVEGGRGRLRSGYKAWGAVQCSSGPNIHGVTGLHRGEGWVFGMVGFKIGFWLGGWHV